ncbi:hypothetical protein [Paludisphaera borealis]|uniref:Uncharacterized protein n=1 Tax=Paludisphaera borealis TaxID=1387353 RepID=A0A1U7CJZ7_9BACT|nr:hypothetical protein [Paludisphaera borealis]APW59251.1 hypothetical protein BSF38_00667 [Paludisphaera borealis]
MSTIDMTVVSGSLQTMIDARLDAIDRALLGRVSRQERLNVVGEVEGRIHELLNDRCGPGVEPSRDDVLAVLSRLDPPEAYLSEGPEEYATGAPVRTPPHHVVHTLAALDHGRFAQLSGILGLCSLAMSVLIMLSYPITIMLNNEIPLLAAGFGGGVFMVIGGAASIFLAILSRLSNVWAVVGAAAGCLSCLAGASCVLFLVSNI